MSSDIDYVDLANSLFQAVNEHLVTEFSHMLAEAAGALDVIAEQQSSPLDKEDSYALRLFIEQQRDDLRQNFFLAVNQRFSQHAEDTDNCNDELALVSEDEMEELVAITTLHGHAMNLYGVEVDHLEARLEYLEICEQISISKDSLNPDKIGQALRDALRTYNLELNQKLQLYKLFEQYTVNRLQPMYAELNALMIDAGILPEIVMKTNRHVEEEKDDVVIMPHRTENTCNSSAEYAIPRSESDISYMAASFMSNEYVADESAIHLPESFRRPVSKPGDDGRQYYERKDVIRALSRLQQQIAESGDTGEPREFEHIKRSLMLDMAESEGPAACKSVNTLDERSIDFVGMLFDQLAEDDSLPLHIKHLLSRLQIPMIKLSMSDETLYQDDNHPARRTLNLISEAGRSTDDASSTLCNRLNDIIDELLSSSNDVESCFTQASNELEQLIDEERAATAAREEVEQKEIMFANAREVIVGEMQHITRQKHIPRNVAPLITKNWPSLMINRYVRHGKDSWQWLESVMLMKLLIKCLQPIRSDSQWQTVWDNHLALVDAVHDELSNTRQDIESIRQQADSLRQTFIDLLDAWGYKLEQAEDNSNDLPVAANDDAEQEDDMHITHIDEVARLAREKLMALPDSVHPGVWFEIYNGEDRAVRRLKLSVVLNDVARLVFVDRKGVKVIEKDAADFTAELNDHKSKAIADHSTFDNALGKVINALAA